MKELILSWVNKIPYGDYLQNKYMFSLAILVIFIILGFIVWLIYSNVLQKLAKKTETKADDQLFSKTKWLLLILIIFYGFNLAVENVYQNVWIDNLFNSVLVVIFVMILMRIVGVIIEVWGEQFSKKTKSQMDDTILPLFNKAVKVVFLVIAFMWVLSIWHIDITPYLAGAGILGLVLGFALQDTLRNVFGGVSLILDKNFNLGDPILLDSGELGVVSEVGLRSTRLTTYDHEVLFVPNGQLANMKIRNYVKPNDRIRKIVEFGVVYGSDVDKVKKVVMGTLKSVKDIYDDPYMDVIFVKMNDFSLDFKARFFVEWKNAYNKYVEVTEKIYNDLNKAGIGIPFPTRTVYLKK